MQRGTGATILAVANQHRATRTRKHRSRPADRLQILRWSSREFGVVSIRIPGASIGRARARDFPADLRMSWFRAKSGSALRRRTNPEVCLGSVD